MGGALMCYERGHFRYTIHHVFPLLYDLELLQQAFTACHVAWNVDATHTELVEMCLGSYRIEEDGKSLLFNVPETAAAMAKALFAARFPHRVESAEVSAFLGTENVYIQDTVIQLFAAGAPLSLMCSLCAHHLGDISSAEHFAQSELSWNLNPVKQL